jgi:putative transposase
VAISFKGAHFPQDILLMGVRWYVAYPLSTCQVEALMLERGVHVDHSTINRWVVKYSPPLEDAFHRRKRPVWISWRMDETSIKVKGQWYYLYRTVDKSLCRSLRSSAVRSLASVMAGRSCRRSAG